MNNEIKQILEALEKGEIKADEALERIAEKALDLKTGARGLRGVIEGILTPIMFSVPSEENVEKVIITSDCVDGSGQPELIRKQPDSDEKKPAAKKTAARKTAKKTDA